MDVAMTRWLLLLLSLTVACPAYASSNCDDLANGITTYGNITRSNIKALVKRIAGKACLNAVDARYAFVYNGHIIEDVNVLDRLYKTATVHHCTFSKEIIPPVPIIPASCNVVSPPSPSPPLPPPKPSPPLPPPKPSPSPPLPPPKPSPPLPPPKPTPPFPSPPLPPPLPSPPLPLPPTPSPSPPKPSPPLPSPPKPLPPKPSPSPPLPMPPLPKSSPPSPKPDVPPGMSYSTGQTPTCIIAADLNGDGHIDLATANVESTVSILLNSGNGTLASTVLYPADPQSVSMTFGDFNGDGSIDLATVENYYGSIVSTVFNNGDGTFAPPVDYSAGSDPDFVEAADFNGDGHIDLATSNAGDTTVSIVFNNGLGEFAFPVSYPTTYNPSAMIVADFNGDGHIDVATASYGASNVSILLNHGDGTLLPFTDYFTLTTDHLAGYQPAYMNAADFNGDGHIDIATANLDGTISVLLGYGDGAFFLAGVYIVGGHAPYAMAVADFNNDGNIDVATFVVNFFDTTISIVLGKGDGTFGPPEAKNYLTVAVGGFEPISVTVADFNNDGNIDLAIAYNDGGDPNISVLFGKGDGTFSDT